MGPKQTQQLRVRVNLGVMAIKRYYTLLKSLELEQRTQDTPLFGKKSLQEITDNYSEPRRQGELFYIPICRVPEDKTGCGMCVLISK